MRVGNAQALYTERLTIKEVVVVVGVVTVVAVAVVVVAGVVAAMK